MPPNTLVQHYLTHLKFMFKCSVSTTPNYLYLSVVFQLAPPTLNEHTHFLFSSEMDNVRLIGIYLHFPLTRPSL